MRATLQSEYSWVFHHDNAPSHNMISKSQFFVKKQLPVLANRLYTSAFSTAWRLGKICD